MEKHFSSLDKEPKKCHLMTLLHPIMHMWDTIGGQLEVPDVYIQCIFEAHQHTRKLSEVLQVWIDNNNKRHPVCWKTIITVIEEPPVQNKTVGNEIYQFLTRPEIQNEYLSPHNQTGNMKVYYVYKCCNHSGQLITTFNSPPPIAPKPGKKKGTRVIYFCMLQESE